MEGSKIILCIPGLWKNRSEIVESVARDKVKDIFLQEIVLVSLVNQ